MCLLTRFALILFLAQAVIGYGRFRTAWRRQHHAWAMDPFMISSMSMCNEKGNSDMDTIRGSDHNVKHTILGNDYKLTMKSPILTGLSKPHFEKSTYEKTDFWTGDVQAYIRFDDLTLQSDWTITKNQDPGVVCEGKFHLKLKSKVVGCNFQLKLDTDGYPKELSNVELTEPVDLAVRDGSDSASNCGVELDSLVTMAKTDLESKYLSRFHKTMQSKALRKLNACTKKLFGQERFKKLYNLHVIWQNVPMPGK